VSALRVGAFLSARLLPFYETAARAAAAALGREPELVTGGSFENLADGSLDAAILCGLPYVMVCERDSGVQALAAPAADGRYGGRATYYSDIVARVGETAGRLEELAGRVLAVNEPDSHSGYNVVAHALAARDVPTGGYADVLLTGGHAASVAAVRAGDADVAAVDSHLLAALRADDPGIETELVVIESLGPSPSQPFAAGPGLAADERDGIRAALTGLPAVDLAPGLEGVRWLAVDDGDYDPIRQMLASSRGRVGF